MLQFIDRVQELAFLNDRFRGKKFEFVVLYGRRRVGKTELIHRFLTGKNHFYFLADKAGTERNIARLRREMAENIGEAEIAETDLGKIFEWFTGKAKERTVIVVDEFSYLVEKDDSIPSVFQRIVDQTLKKTDAMLVLCGSSVSMMEKHALSYKSPLYGRKTGHWKVLPLPFAESTAFFPRNALENNVEFYSVLGGIPFYLEKFSGEKTTLQNIEQEILSKKGRLYEETDFLLKEELREPDVYKTILQAVASGSTKTVEIANAAKIPVNNLDKYLKTLINIGIMEKAFPVTEGPKSKKSHYSLSDPLYRFWFTFCEPHKSDLEVGETFRVKKIIGEQFSSFVGRSFEVICTEFLKKEFKGSWQKIGKWWGAYREENERKACEIDVVALNEKTREILFAECKWKQNVDVENVLKQLKKKVKHVQWNNGTRKEQFAIFAKSFKEKIKEEGVLLVTLKEMDA